MSKNRVQPFQPGGLTADLHASQKTPAAMPPAPPPAPPAAASPPVRQAGAGRTERALREGVSAAYLKFQQAGRTRAAELPLAEMAIDANRVAREAMRDTEALLAEHHALAVLPGHPEPALRRAVLADQILRSVQFELDCLDVLAGAVKTFQRAGQAKLSAARDVVSQSGAQEAKLAPLLTQREEQSTAVQAARAKDAALVAQIIERRTSWIVERLVQAKILPGD